MTAPSGPGSPDRYPYKTPRWILWVVGVVSVAAVIAAFLVGPKDEPKQRASQTSPAPSIEVATTSGRSTTTSPRSTTTTSTAPTTGAPPTTPPTTAAPTTAPPTTAPPTTAPPTTAPPTTAPPTTAPPTTAPPTTAPATVALTSCRVEGGSTIIATGTLTNPGGQEHRFRANAVATDQAGNAVTSLSVELDAGPGATVPWTISQNIDGATASQVSSCRAGGVTPL